MTRLRFTQPVLKSWLPCDESFYGIDETNPAYISTKNKRVASPFNVLATEVTENTEVFSIVGAASAANSSRSDGLFAAKAAPTFTVVQIKTTKQVFASVPLWQTIIVSTH